MKNKIILTKEAMSYKEQIKGNELITKFRIIRDVMANCYPETSVAEKFHMHRNTVWKLIHHFKEKIPIYIQEELLGIYDGRNNDTIDNKSFTKEEIEEKLAPFLNESTKPKWNNRSANKEQEDLIVKYHSESSRIWYKRMHRILRRKKLNLWTKSSNKNSEKELRILESLTFSQLKWIYKRNELKCRKIKTSNGQHSPLYDYNALSCFERLHYDTKTIPDQKALPREIYDKFNLNKDLPIIEWNIIDVKSRLRFIAYSNERTSTFWLNFLIFVIQYIRSNNLISEELRIIIWTDNGSEFYWWSERKEKEWNALLNIMNAEIYSYEPWFDIRKNLIERSHKTDDEEFFIPRWEYINSKKDFLIEACWYSYYYNNTRSHSWVWMNDMTPIEKLKSCWIHNADRLLEFPTMILEENFSEIMKATEIIRLIAYFNEQKELFENKNIKNKNLTKENKRFNLLEDQKALSDLKANFKDFENLNAHYVLTQYLFLKKAILVKSDFGQLLPKSTQISINNSQQQKSYQKHLIFS